MRRAFWWLALAGIVVVAFALDGDAFEREVSRTWRCIRGGKR